MDTIYDKINKVNESYGDIRERLGLSSTEALYEDAIERAWEYYKSLQDDYRKLTGREYEWLK